MILEVVRKVIDINIEENYGDSNDINRAKKNKFVDHQTITFLYISITIILRFAVSTKVGYQGVLKWGLLMSFTSYSFKNNL